MNSNLQADFNLKQEVNLVTTGKPATVEGICFYSKNRTQYLVEYVDGKGDVASAWVNTEDIH